MIAPVPYSASTKLAIQIGTSSFVNGLIALRPVSKPSFSIAPVRRASRSSARNWPTRVAKRRRIGRLGGEPIDHRMLGSEQDERRAVDRVDAGREDLDRVVSAGSPARNRKLDARAFRAADPVALHHDDFLRPLGQRVEPLQQLVRVGRDLEEPLLEIARDDRRSAAPARAVDDLFVREHGLAARAPVHRRALAVRDARARTSSGRSTG